MPASPLSAASSALPDGAALLELEAAVRRSGTGLGADDLQGCWQLDQVWPKGSSRPASFSALLLRGLAARLEIGPGTAAADGAPVEGHAGGADASTAALTLSNAVNLGPLELRFRGPGWLKGTRPLLLFQFDQLELRLAGRLLLQRALPAPAPRRQPFFALIARETGAAGPGSAGSWLAARGRGGGLALWRLADSHP